MMKMLVPVILGLLLLIPPYLTAAAPTPSSSTSTESNPLQRATDEFKILTRDWGMRPNAPPSVQKRQGPKMLWHGRVYEYLRNDALDAIPHEVKQNQGTKSPLRRNQFGFNVAGPVLIPRLLTDRDKTFFMLSYEGVRESISRASLNTIPTAPQRIGDFSHTVDQAGNLLPIYDPTTTAPNPAYNPALPVSLSNLQYLRSTFPGNIIPPSRLVPDVQQLLSYYPLPNAHVGPFNENNYFVNSPQDDTADGIIARVDQSIGSKHRVSFSTSISNGFLSVPKLFANLASPTAAPQNYSRWQAAVNYVLTATSRTVNSLELSASSNVVQAGAGEPSPFPLYQLVGSYLSMGTNFPVSHNARNSFGIRDAVSTQQNKHSLDLTFEADYNQVNSYTPEYPVGLFQFSTGLTSLPGIIGTGDPFASFLLGLPSYAERSVITAPSYFRNSYQSIAGGDKYQLTKTLLLSFKLDLSRRTPRTEKYNRQSTIDPQVTDPLSGLPGALVFAGRDGIPRGLRPTNIDLDLSLGLAWNPGSGAKTGIHASFNRWHEMIPIYDGQWGTQGFNARQTLISPNIQLSPALFLPDGIPPLPTPLPDLSPSAADNTIADFVDMTTREPYYQEASLTIERQLPFSMVLTVGTNYRDGRNVLVGDGATNPNAISPSLMTYGNLLYDQAFRVTLQPFPQFTGFELYGLYPAGSYQWNSGFVQVEKRESFGLSFTATYEYSRRFDNFSGPFANQDLVNLNNDWAPSAYSTPQYAQVSYVYNFPVGPGKPLDVSGWAGPLLGGWSVSGMAYWNDGRPLGFQAQYNNTGSVLPVVYPNGVPGVDPRVANPGPSLWFNPAAFDQPPDFTMGNTPRTISSILGPGANSMDVSLDKRIPLGGTSLDFNFTAFNFLNHANWNYPDTTIGPASAPNVDAGRIIGSHGGRVVQLGLIVSF